MKLYRSLFLPDELKYGPLLKVARENVEKEKPREELLSRPPTVDGAPLEEDYCPTVSVRVHMLYEGGKYSSMNSFRRPQVCALCETLLSSFV